MKLKPIRDRLVVQVLEAETVTKSGLVIPDAAAEKPSQGDVLAAGTGKVDIDGKIVPMVIQAGDRVLFAKTAGQKVKIEDQEYLIMREDDVMAVVNKGE
jgi:chaperonin GroES